MIREKTLTSIGIRKFNFLFNKEEILEFEGKLYRWLVLLSKYFLSKVLCVILKLKSFLV